MKQFGGRQYLLEKWGHKFAESGKVTYEIAGETAIFTDPTTSCGGEKISMAVPSHGALAAITAAIFWKPSIIWYIDRVRVMNPIRTRADGQKITSLDGNIDRAYYTYLTDVRYQVEARFEFNKLHPEFSGEWGNPMKYYCSAAKAILSEGRRSPYLGKTECVPSYIRLCDFGEGAGYYDNSGTKEFGLLYWGLTYPDTGYDDESRHALMRHFWNTSMVDGIITYPRPEDCLSEKIREASMKTFPPKKA